MSPEFFFAFLRLPAFLSVFPCFCARFSVSQRVSVFSYVFLYLFVFSAFFNVCTILRNSRAQCVLGGTDVELKLKRSMHCSLLNMLMPLENYVCGQVLVFQIIR